MNGTRKSPQREAHRNLSTPLETKAPQRRAVKRVHTRAGDENYTPTLVNKDDLTELALMETATGASPTAVARLTGKHCNAIDKAKREAARDSLAAQRDERRLNTINKMYGLMDAVLERVLTRVNDDDTDLTDLMNIARTIGTRLAALEGNKTSALMELESIRNQSAGIQHTRQLTETVKATGKLTQEQRTVLDGLLGAQGLPSTVAPAPGSIVEYRDTDKDVVN